MRTENPSSDDATFAVASRPLAFSDELADVVAELGDDADVDARTAMEHVAAAHAWVATLVERPRPVDGPAVMAAPPEQSRGRRARQAVIEIGGERVSVPPSGELVIGRRGDVVVEHRLASRRHLAVLHGVDGVTCRDLGSANGTWLLRAGVRSVVDGGGCVLMTGDRLVTVHDHELLSVIEVGP